MRPWRHPQPTIWEPPMPIGQIPLGLAVATVHSLQVTSIVREPITLVVPQLSATAVPVNTTGSAVTAIALMVIFPISSRRSLIEKTVYMNIGLQLITGRLEQLAAAFPPKSQP